MIKRLKTLLCLILAMIMPISFVACKSPDKSGDGGTSNDETSGGGASNTTPSETYVLDDAEITTILNKSYDSTLDLVEKINNLGLSDYGYSSEYGNRTYEIFDYALYPSRFVKASETTFEKDEKYMLQADPVKKYFDIDATSSNDKIFVKIMVDEVVALTTYFYEFKVSNGALKSLKLSYLNSTASSIRFSESILDYANSTCEVWLGNLSGFDSSRDFIEEYFTEENFSKSKYAGMWGYSYYQKFVAKDVGSYVTKEDSEMPNNLPMIQGLDKFGMVDSFDIIDEYTSTLPKYYEEIKTDYFSRFFTRGLMSFDGSNCVFKVNKGD